MRSQEKRLLISLLICWLATLALIGCRAAGAGDTVSGAEAEVAHDHEDDHDDHAHNEDDHHDEELAVLTLPALEAADLQSGRLQVVATTSIIGDIVARIGGDVIELTTLMGAGQDPHSYEPSARDLTRVADAHVIFVNGWGLEEGLLRTLELTAEHTPLTPVSANIQPLAFADDDAEEDHGHQHEAEDPHTWFDPHNVLQWVENIEHVLSEVDPANAAVYESNAGAYRAELEALIAYYDEQVATVAPARRKLITNHDTFGYFARTYGFEVVGTVLPAASTLAEPSASHLVELAQRMVEEGVCTIFAETIASDRLAQAVSAEVSHCDTVQVLTLHTDALGPAGSGADSYTGMMRANIDSIVAGLR